MITLTRLRDALRVRWWRATVPGALRRRGVRVGDKAVFYGMPIVTRAEGSTLELGERAVLTSDSAFTALGVSRPCVLRTMRPGARLVVGADCGLSGAVICAAESVTLGRECLLGADVLVADNDFHPLAPERRRFENDPARIGSAPVRIGDNVFIGTRAIVLKGVTIGSNSVIAAGSVVVSDVPPDCIAGGVPARVLRRLR